MKRGVCRGARRPTCASIRPLRDGSIVDFDILERMLRYFMHKIVGRRTLIRPYAVVCVPSGVTDMEKRSVVEAALDAGARRTQLMDSAVAGALGAGLEVGEAYGSMLVDIGGGVTGYFRRCHGTRRRAHGDADFRRSV